MTKLIIYHGSKDIIQKPIFRGGKAHNDYGFGFYCTESLELAKEWACSNNETNGFANKYSINISGLKILDLTADNYSILNWMAILLKHRSFDLTNDIAMQGKSYLIENYYIDVEKYDIVIGYRADDSYFSFARDFVNNSISVRQLSQAMELGQLGKQIVIISEDAFSKIVFEGFETADRLEYYAKRKSRDEKARREYLQGNLKKHSLADDVFLIDIIRRGLK
ncbi:MAG: DUF3990 domain-containing protein [Clostridia bacterium]|nr:DUF3990 domain-containing protein [Clostridia bacterium]